MRRCVAGQCVKWGLPPSKALHRNREQARSHRGLVVNTDFVTTQDPLWERACSRLRPP
ncbi:hypothetical protein EMIT043CA1_60058 [Pseudomonas brassicacearum]